MKLVVISDTHNRHRHLDNRMPPGDVLIHCGDFSAMGRHTETRNFFKWFAAQNYDHKIIIAGNHDLSFEREPDFKEEILTEYCGPTSEIHYLQDEGIVLNGTAFYGSPWQPEFCNWAFNLPRQGEGLEQIWALIPEDTDILITHSPPYEILDRCMMTHPRYPQDAGCELLRKRIEEVEPRYHLFGHIHEAYGMNHYLLENTVCVNASITISP
jgi:Icc-related predicted phosphoesterase